MKKMLMVLAVVGLGGIAAASASVWTEPDPTSVPAPTTRAPFSQPMPVRLKLEGSIDELSLNMAMATRRYELDRCYTDYLREHPETGAGTVILHFGIKPDGMVDEGCQSNGTTLPMEVGRCITDRLMMWEFPMPILMERVEVEYRFDFHPPPLLTGEGLG